MSNTPKPHNQRRGKVSSALEKKAPPVTLQQVNDLIAALNKLGGPKAVAILIQPMSKKGGGYKFSATLVEKKAYAVIGGNDVPNLELGPCWNGDTPAECLANMNRY